MMKTDNRKIALVGTGMVGMSFAYSLLNQSVCDELVLIDADKKRAQGEAMDLNHGVAFAPSSMKIYAGDYSDCADADIVLVDPEAEWVYDGAQSFSKTKSVKGIYQDMKFRGKVAATYVRGQLVYDGKDITAPSGWGEFVRRNP